MKHSRFQLHHSHKAKKLKALGQAQLRFFLLPPLPPSLEAAVKFIFFTTLEQTHLVRYCKEPDIIDACFFSPLLINNDTQVSWVHSNASQTPL